MDPMGGIVMTNDGNAILREINVQHPAAKSLIEIARTQDEEVGDGTTSVIILGTFVLTRMCCLCAFPDRRHRFYSGSRALFVAGEVLAISEQFLEENMHPTQIIAAYRAALEDLLGALKKDVL